MSSGATLTTLPPQPADVIACLTSALSGQSAEKRGSTVLVVDELALSILNAAVPQSEILKAGFMSAFAAALRPTRCRPRHHPLTRPPTPPTPSGCPV